MGKKKSLLERMQANPQGDWQIKDIKTVCQQIGLTIATPKRGSHHTIHSPYIAGILTVPYKRPIKTVYIRMFVGLCKAHLSNNNNDQGA